MRIVVRTLAAIVGLYVALALGVEAYSALAQPSLDDGECVLRTFDASGTPHDTRLALLRDGETLWVQSGHHWRGWYDRVLANPDVELVVDGAARPYRAVALDTADARAHLREVIMRRTGIAGYYAIRTLLLFAPIKPVRLEPVDRSIPEAA